MAHQQELVEVEWRQQLQLIRFRLQQTRGIYRS
jgi:hypothetical protein